MTPTATPDAPDGRISRAQLLAARVDLPTWPSYVPKTCVTADVRLRSGLIPDYVPALLDPELRYADVDGDGAAETVALISCRIGEASAKQVVAFDRDSAGRMVTMGQVVGTKEGLDDITDFTVLTDGHIRAHVGDIQPCCSTPDYWARRQWRTYAWNGQRFTQTGGPAEFDADPRRTDLAVAGGDLVLGSVGADGKRSGTLTLTVSNKGPADVAYVGFKLAGIQPVGEAGKGACGETADTSVDACLLGGVRAGQRRTYTLQVTVDPSRTDKPSAWVWNFDAERRPWQDLKMGDNWVDIPRGS